MKETVFCKRDLKFKLLIVANQCVYIHSYLWLCIGALHYFTIYTRIQLNVAMGWLRSVGSIKL